MHHPDSYAHSVRVSLLSIDLGIENHLQESDLLLLGYGGLLHDAGKCDIPLGILSKPAALDQQEQEVMRGHSRLGFVALADSRQLPVPYELVRKIVVAHHEYKQEPYPRHGRDRRRSARAAPERRVHDHHAATLAEMVAAADIYDALASPRAYKPGFSHDRVESMMRAQFSGNPRYVDQLLRR